MLDIVFDELVDTTRFLVKGIDAGPYIRARHRDYLVNLETPGIRAAKSTLAQHWNYHASGKPDAVGQIPYEFPVNPGIIAAKLNIPLIVRDPSTMPADCFGLIQRDAEGHPSIIYKAGESSARKRFAVAHMIGHIVLGHKNTPAETLENFSATAKDPTEKMANDFAAELLAPRSTLMALFKCNAIDSLDQCAQIFAVSQLLIGHKIVTLDQLHTWDSMYVP